MRQVHRAGEKVFIDYSGKKPVIWSSETGEAIEVELNVAVLGPSNYTYAEATRTQRLDDFCASIAELLEKLNTRPFKKLDGCRRSAFEALDRPALRPLPQTR